MPQEMRRNFSKESIDYSFKLQGGACAKCGLPFKTGFEAHHADGDNTNNCQLLDERCHDSEKYTTMKAQKERALKQTQDMIDLGVQGKLAGAVIDKLLDAIKLELSLQTQIYSEEHFDIPLEMRMETSTAIAEINLKTYQDGYLAGLQKQVDLTGIFKNDTK
jgi:hypothetical protein